MNMTYWVILKNDPKIGERRDSNYFNSVRDRPPSYYSTRLRHPDSANGVWARFTVRKRS